MVTDDLTGCFTAILLPPVVLPPLVGGGGGRGGGGAVSSVLLGASQAVSTQSVDSELSVGFTSLKNND